MSDCIPIHSIGKITGKIFISNKNGVKICQNCDYFFRNLDIFFHIQNSKTAPLFLENFWGNFPISSNFRKKKNYQVKFYQICYPMSAYTFQCFNEVYNFMSGRIQCSGWTALIKSKKSR